nr:uncharacterized protein LOC109182035 [Ipomoea trifida]
MERRGKGRHYAYRGRKARSDYKCSSDEDYKVCKNEVFDESEDEYSSFVGDTSEESLGEYEDKEEEKEMEEMDSRVVKKVVKKNDVRPKAPKRQKNGVVKRRKRKRLVYRGEDDDNDICDDDDDEEEEFTPYGINRVVKRRKRKQVVYREEDTDIDDDDDDDDDDREFTPDEIDGVGDDEDELPMTRRKKKLCKPQLRKGNGKGMQRKRISEVSRKKTRKKNSRKKISKISKKTTGKKRRKKRRVKRKARFDDGDGESMNINTMEKKTRKNIGVGRRKRRIIIDSDSDFVTSESSDLEYTISEEEREQVREASKFCRGLTASWRRPAFLKNSPEEKTQRLQKKRSLRKDKEKVEEVKTESGKQICGICLSEEGKKTIRGTLNCCSHYFCFACIMEWSKVESRCPLCKQRFVTISKPAKSSAGFDLRPVVIQVLERDQVYEPSEEELRGYLDPYENVICTECQQGGDDALMLLCDICDSPSHTYCVGLGHEVPEGNWYCEGCRSSSPGFQNPQNSNRTSESRTVNNFSVRLPPIANMRDTFDLNEIYVPDTPLAQEVHCTPSPRDSQAASPASGSVASTVSDRRRIHRRINQFLSNRTRQVDSRTRDNG